MLEQHRMSSVIETGARFLLDSRVKHHPTLLSEREEDRRCRVAFLKRAVEIAGKLGSDAVSLWSGTLPAGLTRAAAMDRLAIGLDEVLEWAENWDTRLAFEPEPGMFIQRMSEFAELVERIDHPSLGLTIDIGHVHCLDDGPIPEVLERWKDWLVNVHIEDMRRGVHDHLMFGEGEIDFPPVLARLREIGYSGGVHVELSRHSHDAVEIARRSFHFLRSML